MKAEEQKHYGFQNRFVQQINVNTIILLISLQRSMDRCHDRTENLWCVRLWR